MFFVLSIQLDATLYLKNMTKRFFFSTNKSSAFIFFQHIFRQRNHVNYFQSWMLENTWRIISPKIKKNMMERVSWFWYHDQSIWLLNCFKEGEKDAWRGICWHLNFPSNAKKATSCWDDIQRCIWLTTKIMLEIHNKCYIWLTSESIWKNNEWK